MSPWIILTAVTSFVLSFIFGWLIGEWYTGKVARRRHETEVAPQSELDKLSWKPHTYDTLSMDAWFRYRGSNAALFPFRKTDLNIQVGIHESYNSAFQFLEESNDHGKTWHPCGQKVAKLEDK